MPIRLKLLLGFLAVTVMSGFLGAFGVHSVGVMGALAIETYDRPLMAINFARAAETDFVRIRTLAAPLVGGAASPDATLPDEEEVTDLLENFVDNLDVAAERALSAESRELAGSLLASAEDWTLALEGTLEGGSLDAAAHAVETSCEIDSPDARILALSEAMSCSSINSWVTAGTGSCHSSSSSGTREPR